MQSTDTSLSKKLPQGTLVCHGRELQIPDAILRETEVALSTMKEDHSSGLEDFLKSLPHIDPQSCVGVILTLTNKSTAVKGTPLGLVLSTTVGEIFRVVALGCCGTFSMDIYKRRKSMLSSLTFG